MKRPVSRHIWIGPFACALAALAITAHAAEWVTLENCRLMPHSFNDGDSFFVRHGTNEYLFRLYYVDCAETDPGLSRRMKEQAEYWGIAEDQVLPLGKQATEYTANFLKRSFSVKTAWQKALGGGRQQRYYAFVIAPGGRDLGEALIKNGLAQVFGEKRRAPPGYNVRQYLAKLLRFESEARKFRRGAWALLPLNSPLNTERGVRQTAVGAAYVLPWAMPVFDTKDPARQVGRLKENTVVWLTKERDDGLLRFRFEPEDGSKPVEFLGRRRDMGLPDGRIL
jgi:endonuclease YncB( thermonuclease family)